jgi:sigma-B regulation protein RsbU (phosphoserine phosphatase)
MKAAMTAVLTSGMLYSEVQKNASPRSVLRRINHPLYLRSDKRVFTAFSFGVIDLKSRLLRFSCAGQTHPMLVRKGKVQELKTEGLRLPLGIKDDLNYGELKFRLKKGDLLLFYTDGLVEAMNTKGEMYGFERLGGSLLKWHDISAASARDRVLGEIANHTGKAPQHDDMTLVVIRVV